MISMNIRNNQNCCLNWMALKIICMSHTRDTTSITAVKSSNLIFQLNCIIVIYLTTLIISKKPGNTGISRDIRTEFTTDLLLSD